MLKLAPLLAVLLMCFAIARADDATTKVAGGNIVGTVVDAAGRPVADVTVNLYIGPASGEKKSATLGESLIEMMGNKGGNKGLDKGDKNAGNNHVPNPKPNQIVIATATSDAHGVFVMANVAAGDYIIEAHGNGGADRKLVSVTDGAKIPVTLTLGGGGQKKQPKQK